MLCHFNQNHDPRNGQFTTGSGGSGSVTKKKKKDLTNQFPGFKNEDPFSNEYTDSWVKLESLVRKKSGDWYNSKGVSKGFKEYVRKSERLRKKYENDKNKYALDSPYRKEVNKLYEELVDTVLDDIGYEKNKKNRKIIDTVLFWD